MDLKLNDHCENCLKHRPTFHADGLSCSACLPDKGADLQACGGCSMVRYCSQECLREHWKDHRTACIVNKDYELMRAGLADSVLERHASFTAWCEDHANIIGTAALSALGLVNDSNRINEVGLVVYLDTDTIDLLSPDTEQGIVSRFVRSIRKATVVPVSIIDHIHSARLVKSAATAESLKAQKGKMRILVMDDGLPRPLDVHPLYLDPLIEEVTLSQGGRGYDANWLAHLKSSVDDKNFPKSRKILRIMGGLWIIGALILLVFFMNI